MKALMLDAEDYLADRRRKGIDRWDELWDGVVHMVPPPSTGHQRFESDLEHALRVIAKRRAWLAYHNVGIFNPLDVRNYRVPDNVIADPRYVSKRGIEGRTELAVEIRSPNDESYEKMPFYAKVGVQEYWIVVHETPSIEVYGLCEGAFVRTEPAGDGVITTPALGLLVSIRNQKLVIADGEDAYEI
jgi:Uma2 family endonuclease